MSWTEESYRLLDGVVIDDTNLFNTKLKEWEDYYNYHRSHGALDGQTPYEGLRQKTHSDVADLPQSHRVNIDLSSLRLLIFQNRILRILQARARA